MVENPLSLLKQSMSADTDLNRAHKGFVQRLRKQYVHVGIDGEIISGNPKILDRMKNVRVGGPKDTQCHP